MAEKTPSIKIGDTTYVKKDEKWVDKKDKTNTPVPPHMQKVLDQSLAQSQALPVEDKGLDSLEKTVKTGDAKEQESLLALIDRVKELNKTMSEVEAGVAGLGDKLKGGGPNEPSMSPQDQIKNIKLSIGELLNAAIKGAIGEGSRSGGKFMETYNQLRAVPQIEKDPESGKYINKLTGKEHGEADYREEQEKYSNRPGRLVSAATAGVAGVGKYFQGVGERLDPTGIVRRFNDLKQNNTDQIKANEYEQKRVAGLPSGGSNATGSDAKPVLNTGDHMSAQAGVRITDISQNVITRLADAITKSIKGDAPPPATPEEIAPDSLPAAANDNMHPDATKVPDENPNGSGAGLLLGMEGLFATLKSKIGDIFEGIAKFGKKMADAAGEFIGSVADKAKKIVGDLLEGAGKLLDGAKRAIGGIADEGGKLIKGGMKAAEGVAEGAGKAFGVGGKVAGGLVKGGMKAAEGVAEDAGGLVKGGLKAAGGLAEGAGGLVKGGLKAAGGLAEGAGGIVKGAVKSVGGLAEGAGKALGTKALGTVGRAIPVAGAAIGAGISGYEEYEKSGNLAKAGFVGAGALGGALAGEAVGTAIASPVGGVVGEIGGGFAGAAGGGALYDKMFGKNKPANVPVKPSVVPKTAAVAGMTNKIAAMKDQAASSKSSSPIISSDNSSKTTVINNNSNMSMMLPTAADRGSLRLATYT